MADGEDRWWRALAGGSGSAAAFAAHCGCTLLILFGTAGLHIGTALVRQPGALLTGFNHHIGPVLIWLDLAAALLIGVAVFRTSRRRGLVWRLFWAIAVALAVLGSILPVSMFLGRETLVISYLLGWTLLSSAVPFLALWAVCAVVALWRSNLTTPQLLTALRHGMDGGLIAVGMAWAIALIAGGNLVRLVALNGFYALLMSTVIGFGLAISRPTRPSGWFAAASVALAACMAFYTMPWPFAERHEVGCQWWYPAGRHEIFAFHDEPWHWRSDDALTWLTAPAALGDLTILNIVQPLTELRCASPRDDDPWSEYGL